MSAARILVASLLWTCPPTLDDGPDPIPTLVGVPASLADFECDHMRMPGDCPLCDQAQQ